MKSFKIIAHTADIRLNMEATSMVDLFEIGLAAMSDILQRNFCKKRANLSLKKQLSISSGDQTALFIDFLSEVLTLSFIENAVFCRVKFGKLIETELKATVWGEKINHFDEDIKAVTYHEAAIVMNKRGNYETRIVFDI